MNEKKIENCKDTPTVNGLIEILKSLPKDSEVEITDEMIIHDITDDGKSLSIINTANCSHDHEDEVIDNENYDIAHDKVLETYFNGVEPEIVDAIRHTSSGMLYEHPICFPSPSSRAYEAEINTPLQQDMINEIREKNAFMADVLAEQFRRGLAAMFEYNTQCMYRYGRTMCNIVNPDNKDNL